MLVITITPEATELDPATAPALDEQLQAAQGDDITLDLRKVTFIDSSGLRVILNAHVRAWANERTVVLTGATKQTQRLFAVVGLAHLLR